MERRPWAPRAAADVCGLGDVGLEDVAARQPSVVNSGAHPCEGATVVGGEQAQRREGQRGVPPLELRHGAHEEKCSDAEAAARGETGRSRKVTGTSSFLPLRSERLRFFACVGERVPHLVGDLRLLPGTDLEPPQMLCRLVIAGHLRRACRLLELILGRDDWRLYLFLLGVRRVCRLW